MKKLLFLIGCGCLVLVALGTVGIVYARTQDNSKKTVVPQRLPPDYERAFDIQLLVDGRPLDEYAGQGRSYVEAIAGAEYEVRIRNLQPYRVAVALSVDGLNTIDARHTSAWNASKWVIEPYGSITVGGWQMSSERARRFYFTSERDSYGAKLGQTSNLGVISAVFFREIRPRPVTVAPPPRPRYEEDGRYKSEQAPSSQGGEASENKSADSASTRRGQIAPQPGDDEYAATGIGRSVRNDVRWVDMDLDSRAIGEQAIRYEYYSALVRLGILPRRYERPDSLRRREAARGFEDRRFSPEP
ncbi:MAG TPA: hypothetical protein VLL54_05635 [Pyrinomonadaceae bacterium]|nr:hypothetical protein [Pyrinomonadaceae bacterium]